MTHTIAPLLLAIPLVPLAVYFGITAVRCTLNADATSEGK